MTANYIARIVQSEFDKMNLEQEETIYRWVRACELLKDHIRHNFHDFEQTELVYTWAKDLCETKILLLNKHRMSLLGNSFQEWLIDQGFISKSGRFF